MLKRFLQFVILDLAAWVCLSSALLAQSPPEVMKAVEEGQKAVFRLDFEEAERIFRRLKSEHPRRPEAYGMLTTVKLNQLLFAAKNLALDDYATPTPFTKQPTYKNVQEERVAFLKSVQQLEDFCDRGLAGDPDNVLLLYFKGVGYENLATEALAVRKDTGSAQKFGRRARNLHERVLELRPGLVDANMSLAVHEFAAATLPWRIKWLAFLLGIRGNKERALERLQLVSEKGIYRSRDAQVLLALLQAWKGDPSVAARIFRDLRRDFPQNFLSDINLAAVYELLLNDPKKALEVYRELLSNLEVKAPGIRPAEVHYRIGQTYLQLGEYSRAMEAFEKAVQEPHTEEETHPLAYFHMAQIHERRGETEQAREKYRQVLRYKGPEDLLEDQLEEARKKIR
ncbi:MAG TPA: tetratricopeptide repeat protein [Acidobacteriota bacterium]|nr:tetratricopeptide repeat protein [Acidobacteriota bacterium]